MSKATCPTCKGKGQIVTYLGMTATSAVCETCGGAGTISPMTDTQLNAWLDALSYEPARIAVRELIDFRKQGPSK